MFGVDTASALTPDSLETIQAACGSPLFVGRYLPFDALSLPELSLYQARKIAVLPIWNGESPASVGGGYDSGFARAVEACRQWTLLGLPEGKVIYCDIEQSWSPTGPWMQGWMEGCHSRNYIGGFYLNPQYGINHSAAYQWARNTSASPSAVYTAQNEVSRQPQHTFFFGPDGAEAVSGFEEDTMVWQTWEEALSGLVDLDCATEEGYSLMWGSLAPVTTVAVPGQKMKPLPNHLCPTLQPVLPVGTVLKFTPSPTGQTVTPHWAFCRVKTGPLTGRKGWLLRDKLRTVYE